MNDNKKPENNEIRVNLQEYRQPTTEELRESIHRISDRLKEAAESYFSPESADIHRQLKKLLEAQPELTAEEAQDLEEARSFLKAYEKHRRQGLVTRQALPPVNTFGLMNDKTSTQLITSDAFTQEINGQLRLAWGTDQKPGEENAPITYIALSFDNTDSNTKISKRMTAFDNAVYNAVSTLFYYWRQKNGKPMYITPQEVWRTMNGKKGDARPGERQVKRIKTSLDKMRKTMCYIDFSQEVRAHYIVVDDQRLISGIIETYLLKADRVSFTTEKGRVVEGYRITDEPILYTYNRAKNHVLWFDYDLLDTSQKTSDSENVVEFRNYLLSHIQNMKYGKFGNRVLIDTIYEKTGITRPADRISRDKYTEKSYKSKISQERKKDLAKIEGILKSWVSKKWIMDYKTVKKGASVIAIDVILQNKKIEQKS